MLFLKKEILNSKYYILLSIVITTFILSVAVILFSLSSAIKINHHNYLMESYPNGMVALTERKSNKKYADYIDNSNFIFYISSSKNTAFYVNDLAYKQSESILYTEYGIEITNYLGYFIQTKSPTDIMQLIDHNLNFIEGKLEILEINNLKYSIYLEKDFSEYLNASVGDSIVIRYFDDFQNVDLEKEPILAQVAGIYEDKSFCNYFLFTTNLDHIYEVSSVTPSVSLEKVDDIYNLYFDLKKEGIMLHDYMGLFEFIEMNQMLYFVFLILSIFISSIGLALMLHMLILIIKSRLIWISMMKSFGLSHHKLTQIFLFIMIGMLLISELFSFALTYILNQRMNHLANEIFSYEFILEYKISNTVIVYSIALFMVIFTYLFMNKYIEKHSSYAILTTGE